MLKVFSGVSGGLLILATLTALAPSASATSQCEEAPNHNAWVCAAVDEDCGGQLGQWSAMEDDAWDGELFVGVCESTVTGQTFVCVTDPEHLPNTAHLVCVIDTGSQMCVSHVYFTGYDPYYGYPTTYEDCVSGPLPSATGTAIGAVNLAVGLALFVALTAVGLALWAASLVLGIVLCVASNPVLSCI